MGPHWLTRNLKKQNNKQAFALAHPMIIMKSSLFARMNWWHPLSANIPRNETTKVKRARFGAGRRSPTPPDPLALLAQLWVILNLSTWRWCGVRAPMVRGCAAGEGRRGGGAEGRRGIQLYGIPSTLTARLRARYGFGEKDKTSSRLTLSSFKPLKRPGSPPAGHELRLLQAERTPETNA